MNWKQNKQITEQVNIVRVIEQFIALKKRGNNYFGICPFHDDNKPSLVVSEKKQYFKCFACDTGGDAIKFIMLFKNLPWKAAVKWLCEQFNLSIGKDLLATIPISPVAKSILKINEEAKTFFQINLLSHPTALAYCQKRRISAKMITSFQLGWIGDDESVLQNYLQKKGINEADLLNSGLFLYNQKKRLKSYFHNRLIFPILDENGVTVGFSGRLITDVNNETNHSPKYLNSQENEVFKKQHVLYNLYYVNQNFPAVKTLYITEGFLDSIRLNSLKYPAISLMGVNLSKFHINLIKERYQKIIIFPDHDRAGILSAIKNSEIFYKNKITVRIVSHSLALDPDLCLQKSDFNLEATLTLKPVDFIMSKTWTDGKNHSDIETVIMAIKKFIPYLTPVEIFQTSQKMHKKYGIPLAVLTKEWEKQSPKGSSKQQTTKTMVRQNALWKKFLFLKMLFSPEIIGKTMQIDGTFNDMEYDYYYQLLINWYQENPAKDTLTTNSFLKFLKHSKEKAWVEQMYQDSEQWYEITESNIAIVNECLKKFRIEKLQIEKEQLNKILTQTGDEQVLLEIQKKIQEINEISSKMNLTLNAQLRSNSNNQVDKS